jgi:hypothetical protein
MKSQAVRKVRRVHDSDLLGAERPVVDQRGVLPLSLASQRWHCVGAEHLAVRQESSLLAMSIE